MSYIRLYMYPDMTNLIAITIHYDGAMLTPVERWDVGYKLRSSFLFYFALDNTFPEYFLTVHYMCLSILVEPLSVMLYVYRGIWQDGDVDD